MPPGPGLFVPVLAAVLLLGGCNRAGAPASAASVPAAPAAIALPEGGGCAGDIARYRAVLDNDLAMGHVNASVYGQARSELAEAEDACAIGRGARASALVRASKARHGYRT